MSKKIIKRGISICCIAVLLCTVFLMTGCGGNDETQKEVQIEKISDLSGKRISVLMDSMNAVNLISREDIEDETIIYEGKMADGLSKLITGNNDALVIDNINAQEIVKKYDGLKILDESLEDDFYGYPFSKDSAFREEFNEYLNEMLETGELARIEDEWMEGKPDDVAQPAQNWEGRNGTIVCGADFDSAPMTQLNSAGDVVGIDVDVILAIAEKMDCKVKFVDDTIGELIPAVSAGDYDMGASGLTITEGRKELVDFTDPYMSASTVVLVRDVKATSAVDSFWYSIGNSLHKVFVENARWKALLKGFGMTVLVSMTSMVTGLIFGFILFMWYYSGSKLAKPILGAISRILSLLPGMIWLFIVYYIFYAGTKGSGFAAAITAFAVSFGFGFFGNLKGSVGTLPVGQREAAFAMGYSKFGTLFKILIPQALPSILGGMEGDIIGLIKGTCLVELIAVQDIQAVADIILAETGVPFLPVILPAIAYVIFAGATSRLIRVINRKILSMKDDQKQIQERVMKGRL